MSSLIRTALVHKTRTTLPVELLASSFHSSATSLSKRKPKKSRQSTRTRLAPILNPKERSSFGLVEVADSNESEKAQREHSKKAGRPTRPEFVRDTLPHPDATDVFKLRERAGRRPRRTSLDYEPAAPGRGFRGRIEKTTIYRKAEVDRPTSAPRFSSADAGDAEARFSQRPRSQKPKVDSTLVDEFDRSVPSEPVKTLPSEFTSPPLMPGLLDSVIDVLGPHATPTPIQGLAIKHVLYPWKSEEETQQRWREFLLASETGSGKSLAYMLPMLQDLKTSELASGSSVKADPRDKNQAYNPRALILAPTHELSRQLSSTAKALLHNIKLRVLCSSRANLNNASPRNFTASKMAAMFADSNLDGDAIFEKSKPRPIDIMVGTPSKVLEMVRGHGWNWDALKENLAAVDEWDEKGRKIKRKEFIVGQPEMGLHRIEWVVIDEADVLFDPDFQESTRLLLSDIAAARGKPLPVEAIPVPDSPIKPAAIPHNYPFNLILNSATIPVSLASYLDTHHPHMKRLVSPNLHHLPSNLKTEHAPWTSGNRPADVEARIKRIWYADVHQGDGKRSKILVFCNKSTKVEEFGKYLQDNGIPNIALTGTSVARHRGNNHHLDGFLRKPLAHSVTSTSKEATSPTDEPTEGAKEDASTPYVLITTSLLSRGLDFSPEIKNVLIVDAPRNMLDFLHRAGRTGRAGEKGTVIIFGKSKGRGAGRDKETKSRVRALR